MNRLMATIGLAAAVHSGCQKQAPVAARQPVAVRTVAAEPVPDSGEIRYSGIVAPDTQVDLAFRIPGYVEWIGTAGGRDLQEGDLVAAGTILARLRSTEYQTKVSYAESVAAGASASLKAVEAQAREADAGLTQAERDFERAKALFAEKALTRADFDAAEARKNAAVARRAAAAEEIAAQRARIDGAGSQQKEASITLNDTQLAAPFPGVILAKRATRGSLVSAGAPVFVLADTRTAKVAFGVPDLALRSFRPGGMLSVFAEAIPDHQFRGRISSIAPAADPANRVFAVEVSIPNPARLLKIGMVATVVTAAHDQPSKAPSVPLAAVVRSGNGFGVFVVEKDRARLRPVTIGEVRGNAAAVTSGLNAGDRVIATGGLQLNDGDEVRQIP